MPFELVEDYWELTTSLDGETIEIEVDEQGILWIRCIDEEGDQTAVRLTKIEAGDMVNAILALIGEEKKP